MKTIRTIVIGLGAMLIISLVMVFVTMAHPPLPKKTSASQVAAHPFCGCKGQCMR